MAKFTVLAGVFRGTMRGRQIDLETKEAEPFIERGLLAKGKVDAEKAAPIGESPTGALAPTASTGGDTAALAAENLALRNRVSELESGATPTPDTEAQAARIAELEAQLAAAPVAVIPDGWLSAESLSGMTVDDANAYLDEHPEQREYILALERAGDARKGITGD